MAKQSVVVRTVERAALRRGPAWTFIDAALLVLVLLGLAVALLAPGLLADIGDTVLGNGDYDPALGVAPSSLLLVLGRAAIVLQVVFLLWNVREAPLAQRVAWTGVSLGLLMNYARNYYTGSPATVSFILIQACLAYLIWRLTMRPTIWQQLVIERARGDAAEAEVAIVRERAEAEVAEAREDLSRLDRLHLRARTERDAARTTLNAQERAQGLTLTTWAPDPPESLGGTP